MHYNGMWSHEVENDSAIIFSALFSVFSFFFLHDDDDDDEDGISKVLTQDHRTMSIIVVF